MWCGVDAVSQEFHSFLEKVTLTLLEADTSVEGVSGPPASADVSIVIRSCHQNIVSITVHSRDAVQNCIQSSEQCWCRCNAEWKTTIAIKSLMSVYSHVWSCSILQLHLLISMWEVQFGEPFPTWKWHKNLWLMSRQRVTILSDFSSELLFASCFILELLREDCLPHMLGCHKIGFTGFNLAPTLYQFPHLVCTQPMWTLRGQTG